MKCSFLLFNHKHEDLQLKVSFSLNGLNVFCAQNRCVQLLIYLLNMDLLSFLIF